MTNYVFEDGEIEDINFHLFKVEKSFGIKFAKNENEHITTYGEFCDHIANKIQLEHSGDCTTQQAFYKLRNAISSKFKIDHKTITTDCQIIDILPRRNRHKKIAELEKYLGFKLNILRPPHLVTMTLLVLCFVSLVGIYFNWQIGILGLIISMGGIWVADKIGIELEVKTVGELAKKMARENYLKSRRNSKTFNKHEIEKILTDWFSNDLGLDRSKLVRDAKFA